MSIDVYKVALIISCICWVIQDRKNNKERNLLFSKRMQAKKREQLDPRNWTPVVNLSEKHMHKILIGAKSAHEEKLLKYEISKTGTQSKTLRTNGERLVEASSMKTAPEESKGA